MKTKNLLKVTIKINGKEIIYDNIYDVDIIPDGDGVTKAYVVMKFWSESFNRWEYPHVYSKPDVVLVRRD